MEIVTGIIIGPAVGAAFELLFSSAIEAHRTARMFPALLSDLKSTLESLQPLIPRIEQSGTNSVSENFARRMERGKNLVERCDMVRPGMQNMLKQYKYATKIRKLDKSLRRLLHLLTVQLASNSAQNPNQHLITDWCTVPPLPLFTDGLVLSLENLRMKLLKDDEGSMLVVTAPGGCGKTTLAKMFCHDQKVKDKFKHNIFFARVSTKHSYVVVQELCQHAAFPVPDLQNDAMAFNWLERFLMSETGQNPLLVVLDDVKSGSESLLNKFHELKRSNHKILVTSRYHFPNVGLSYYLEPLTDEYAMILFRRSAFLPNTSSNIPDDLQRKILKCCKRFPLAISVIGLSLRNQPIAKWNLRLTEFSEGSILEYSEESLENSEESLLSNLKSCLDDLGKGMVKDCFIDLGLFPEDQRIPVAALLDMWAELYEGVTDDESIVNLYEITTRNLANHVVIRNEYFDGYYGEHFISQHDALRLLSIHESGQDRLGQRQIIDICGNELPKWWKDKKHKTKNARLVSISTDEEFSGKWKTMDLQKARGLVLNIQTKNYPLPKFLKKMRKLKVLIVTNYGFSPAELSDSDLLGSLSNLKRLRLERIIIPSIIKNNIQLKSLKKISLFMCNVRQAFSSSSVPILKAFPCLEELNIDYCNDFLVLPTELCDLIDLRILSITNCHKLSALPEDIGKLVNLNVLRLRSCTELLSLPSSVENLAQLQLLDIHNCFSIKELPEGIGKMSGLRKINMGLCSGLEVLPPSVFDLDQQLEKVICDEAGKSLWTPVLSDLEKIEVVKEEFNLNWLHKRQF